MKHPHIAGVTGMEVLDSRGQPTVLAQVTLSDGAVGSAMVPSGASTGKYEAHERRDGDPARYRQKGVQQAVAAIEQEIAPLLIGSAADSQATVDRRLCRLDGTAAKERLGANSLLAVSLAFARAAARSAGRPLWQSLAEGHLPCRLPCPMMNVLNGGVHASNNLDIQEFMLVPTGAPTLAEAVRCGCEIRQVLGEQLRQRGLSVAVGDEGGFAPDLSSDEEALELLSEAIRVAGYAGAVRLAVDAAASEWATAAGTYWLPKSGRELTTDELIAYWRRLAAAWPLISVEDGLGEDDHRGWQALTAALGDRLMLVGDDLFVTQRTRLLEGARQRQGNAVLIKPNQVGTLTETRETIRAARTQGFVSVISHRSGDTEDPFIADLAVAVGAPFIKAGAPCRSERTAKYNRLLIIERALGCAAVFGD